MECFTFLRMVSYRHIIFIMLLMTGAENFCMLTHRARATLFLETCTEQIGTVTLAGIVYTGCTASSYCLVRSITALIDLAQEPSVCDAIPGNSLVRLAWWTLAEGGFTFMGARYAIRIWNRFPHWVENYRRAWVGN